MAAVDESERSAPRVPKNVTLFAFSEIVLNLNSPSRAVMHNSESVEGINVVAVTRDWLCQMFLLELREAF